MAGHSQPVFKNARAVPLLASCFRCAIPITILHVALHHAGQKQTACLATSVRADGQAVFERFTPEQRHALSQSLQQALQRLESAESKSGSDDEDGEEKQPDFVDKLKWLCNVFTTNKVRFLSPSLAEQPFCR